MSIFDDIKDINEYLVSIHNLKGEYYSIDLQVLKKWVLPESLVNDETITRYQIAPKNDPTDLVGVRFTGEATKEGSEALMDKVRLFIFSNLERERKEILFVKTIERLKEVFDGNSLDKLKTLKFYFANGKKSNSGVDRIENGETNEGETQERSETGEGEAVVRGEVEVNQ